MLRSMFSAISGLRAHQTKMDVTGNNIANVNTVGFKGSQTVFQDTLSQVIRAGGAPAADRGGTNPAQVGLGVKVAAITTNWTQGATQSTGRSTDFMIEGDGFFVTRARHRAALHPRRVLRLRRRGQAGHPRRRDPAGLDGRRERRRQHQRPDRRPVGALRPDRQPAADHDRQSSRATSPPARPPATSFQTGVTMYDSQGVAQKVFYNFTKTAAANTWTLDVTARRTAPTWSPARRSRSTLRRPDDRRPPPATLAPFTPPAATFPAGPARSPSTWPGMTQFGGANTLAAPEPERLRARLAAVLPARQRRHDHRRLLQRAAPAPGQAGPGLVQQPQRPGEGRQLAPSASASTPASRRSAWPASGGRGVAACSGALEMSNVDLAEEFTGLIVAQRGFQANSRVITSSDEILQDLVNLKR